MNPPPKDGCKSSFPATRRLSLKDSTMKKTTNKKTSKEKTSSSKAATKTSKAKSPSVSKYFQKNNEQDKKESENQANSDTPPKNKDIFNNSASDDDFRSPMILRKRNNLTWKLNKEPKQQKTTQKKRKNKKVKTRNSTIQIIQENFKNTGANPDHLQMAIALSKSTYEAENGHSSDAVSKEETPNISQILQNAKTTNLERFGFKSDKRTLDVENRRIRMAEQSKRTKNRFKYITPTLNLRSSEDRESLIVSKMSLILNQPQPTPKEPVECLPLCSKIREFHCKNRSVFRLDRIYESNCFYVDTWPLTKNTYKCGCLLKDFNSIPGRDVSPKRHNRNVCKSISGEESTSEKCSKPIWMSDNKDSGFTSFGTCTTSSSYRCVSPDLFGSDDDQYTEDLDVNIVEIDHSIKTQLEKSNETVDLTDEDINKSNSSNSFIRPASFYSLDEFEMEEVDINMETNEENVIIDNDSVGDCPLNNHIESNSFDGKLPGSAENRNPEDEITVNSSRRMSSPSSPSAGHNKSLPKNEQSLECIEISDESSLDHDCEDLNILSPPHSSERCLTAKPATNQSFSSNEFLKDLQSNEANVSSNIDNSLESPISQSSSWVDPNEQSLKSLEILDEDHHCGDVNVPSPHSSQQENIHKPATNQSFSSNESLKDLQSNEANVSSNKDNSLESPKSQRMDYLSSSWVEPNEQSMESIEILDDHHCDDMNVLSDSHSSETNEKQENIPSPCSHGSDNISISKHKYLTKKEENIGLSDQIRIPSISPPSNNLETLNDSLTDIHYESVPTQSPVFDDDHTQTDREHSLNSSDGSTHKTEKGTVNSSMEDTPKTSSARNSDMYNSAQLNVTDYVNQLLNQDDFGNNFCEENVSLSQSSQSSIVDEELNYSSHFATPGKFQNQTPMSPDLVILDDLSDELKELPVPPKNTSPHSTPLKPPLENTEITTKKSISTPDNYIIKAKNVTPMPDYDTLTTPLIKKELEKIGVKPIKRARGVKLLQYIYNSTHPVVGSVEVVDSEDDNRVIKRRKISCEVISPESSFRSIEIIGDQIIENEKPEELIFERRGSGKIPSCQVPLQIIWHNFLSCNPDIKENILLYEPLQLESLHMMLKEQGFKFHVQDLLTFLDKKCITIRTAQKQGKRHR